VLKGHHCAPGESGGPRVPRRHPRSQGDFGSFVHSLVGVIFGGGTIDAGVCFNGDWIVVVLARLVSSLSCVFMFCVTSRT